jgi:hypothetical protein
VADEVAGGWKVDGSCLVGWKNEYQRRVQTKDSDTDMT